MRPWPGGSRSCGHGHDLTGRSGAQLLVEENLVARVGGGFVAGAGQVGVGLAQALTQNLYEAPEQLDRHAREVADEIVEVAPAQHQRARRLFRRGADGARPIVDERHFPKVRSLPAVSGQGALLDQALLARQDDEELAARLVLGDDLVADFFVAYFGGGQEATTNTAG